MVRIDWKKLGDIWQQRSNIIAVWAFGSSQNGIIREGSDVDLGVLFASAPSLDELTDLSATLQEALHIEEIDLIPLSDKTSPLLRFEALCGQCLYSADDDYRAAFTSLSAREYEDEMAMLESYVYTSP